MRKTFQPTGKLVSLSPIPADKTPGGLITPENAKNPYVSPRGHVVGLGSEAEGRGFKEGDVVLYDPRRVLGTVMHKGVEVTIVHMEGILGPEL